MSNSLEQIYFDSSTTTSRCVSNTAECASANKFVARSGAPGAEYGNVGTANCPSGFATGTAAVWCRAARDLGWNYFTQANWTPPVCPLYSKGPKPVEYPIVRQYRLTAALQKVENARPPLLPAMTMPAASQGSNTARRSETFLSVTYNVPGPGGPCNPVSPFCPWGPWAPVSPFAPGRPGSPLSPLGPCAPEAPVSPLGPGGPCGPGSPLSPLGPAGPCGPSSPPGHPMRRTDTTQHKGINLQSILASHEKSDLKNQSSAKIWNGEEEGMPPKVVWKEYDYRGPLHAQG